jgi:hypothetical protein
MGSLLFRTQNVTNKAKDDQHNAERCKRLVSSGIAFKPQGLHGAAAAADNWARCLASDMCSGCMLGGFDCSLLRFCCFQLPLRLCRGGMRCRGCGGVLRCFNIQLPLGVRSTYQRSSMLRCPGTSSCCLAFTAAPAPSPVQQHAPQLPTPGASGLLQPPRMPLLAHWVAAQQPLRVVAGHTQLLRTLPPAL